MKVGKATLGNDDASERNIEAVKRTLKADNFEPVFVSRGTLLAITMFFRKLPRKPERAA